jgi:hypothetical protein
MFLSAHASHSGPALSRNYEGKKVFLSARLFPYPSRLDRRKRTRSLRMESEFACVGAEVRIAENYSAPVVVVVL